jgi:hypothetical protein
MLAASLAAKKKNPDETQTLALPKEPPQVAIGEASKLLFHVSPLSGKGLLSQQTRDALKALIKANGGVPVIHIRAFIAGGGDIRRVPQIVSEIFTDKKLPLPSVSVVLTGGLPVENAQVLLESISAGKKEVNPDGVQFVSSEAATASDPAAPVSALLAKSVSELAGKIPGGAALQVSCFVSNLANSGELTGLITTRFPGAAVSLVQSQRAPWQAYANCEAVVRSAQGPAQRLAFTGTRVAFGSQEKDAVLAFQRLDKDLTDALAPPAGIVFSNIYTLSRSAGDLAKKIRPRSAMFPVEGLASIDAGFAADAVAVVGR